MGTDPYGDVCTIVETSITRPANTTAYADGDAITDSATSPTDMEFDSCARTRNGAGAIVSATIVDSVKGTRPTGFYLYLFDTEPTPTNDNEAFVLTDANANDLIGVITFTDAEHGIPTGANNAVLHRADFTLPFVCLGDDKKLYGLLAVSGAYTPGSAEVFHVRLGIVRD